MTFDWADDELDEYSLVRPLGSGAMGEVFLGHDRVLDRPVAIKFIRASSAPDRVARERFLNEARAIARLQHPNVVALFRVGEARGRPYLVSEFVRGQSLDRCPRPLQADQALAVARGLARGLAAVHRRGVLHRDIKPANAILAEDGEAKLLDFGLAKLIEQGPRPAISDGPAPSKGRDGADVGGEVGATRSMPGERVGVDDREAVRPSGGLEATARSPASGLETTADLPADTPAAPPSGEAAPTPSGVTEPGALLGTPRYLAPELWLGEPATTRSDIFALGALLYELCAGHTPYRQQVIAELRRAVLEDDVTPLGEAAPGVDPRLAAVVDRCLRRDPAARFANGEELSHALGELGGGEESIPAGNPYRGLNPFDVEHRGLFFGRNLEIRDLIETLRAEPLVVLTGDSGVGKSSLCGAGLMPLINAGALGQGRAWTVARLTPGRRPLLALLEAILPDFVPADESPLAWLEGRPDAPARALRRSLGAERGVVLFLDQIEELVTQSDPREAALFAEIVGHLADRAPGVRVLITARGDFLTRLVGLPVLGPLIGRAVYVLGPLSRESLREVVVGPARATGVRFESEEMVEILVEATLGAEGGLPLLEFALAELWEARDVERKIIPVEALEAIGGVSGALARHADAVLARLLPGQQGVARRLLQRLVTAQGTGARRLTEELVESPDDQPVLDTLVKGRLVCAQEGGGGTAYTLAHEALLRSWATLRGWLERDVERRVLRGRLEVAAAEWVRLGRPREALLGRQQVREVQEAELSPADFGPREAEFLTASRVEDRRRTFTRLGLAIGLPAALLGAYFAQSFWARTEREARIGVHLGEAERAVARAQGMRSVAATRRRDALARFDEGDVASGEQAWEHVLRAGLEARAAYKEAGSALETALLIDSRHGRLRRRFAELLYEQALFAGEERRDEARDDLLARLLPYDDDGALRRAASAPARLRVLARPAGAVVTVRRYEQQGLRRTLGPPQARGEGAADLRLPPGSYRVEVEAPSHTPVRYPVLLAAGEDHRAELSLPPAASVPEGFVYVPAGRFLFGSADDENWRRTGITAQPMHEVSTPAYLIGRTEVTMASWLAYLRALQPEERQRRRPHAGPAPASIDVAEDAPGSFTLVFARPNLTPQRAHPGEPLRMPVRKERAEQDWSRLPVTGISWEDSLAYAAWLDRTGQVRGARLCTEHEWERAARGADERRYPHGDDLAPEDANHDVTYGRLPLGFGPDEVGSHPLSESPFGLQDMAGNVWEWTQSANRAEPVIYRGGGWYEGRVSSLSINRSAGEAGLRHITMGLRLCASFDPNATGAPAEAVR